MMGYDSNFAICDLEASNKRLLKSINSIFIFAYACWKYMTFIIRFLPFQNIFKNEEVICQKPFCYEVKLAFCRGNDVTALELKMLITSVLHGILKLFLGSIGFRPFGTV